MTPQQPQPLSLVSLVASGGCCCCCCCTDAACCVFVRGAALPMQGLLTLQGTDQNCQKSEAAFRFRYSRVCRFGGFVLSQGSGWCRIHTRCRQCGPSYTGTQLSRLHSDRSVALRLSFSEDCAIMIPFNQVICETGHVPHISIAHQPRQKWIRHNLHGLSNKSCSHSAVSIVPVGRSSCLLFAAFSLALECWGHMFWPAGCLCHWLPRSCSTSR